MSAQTGPLPEYLIIRSNHAKELEKKVNESIEHGHIPYGTPFIDKAGDLCQAMVTKQLARQINH